VDKARTPARSAACRRRSVPPTLVAVCAAAYGRQSRVSAAAWKTASQPSSAASRAAPSSSSPRTGTPPAAAMAASLSARRDSARTLQPVARNSRNRCPPRKPLAPVRNTLPIVPPLGLGDTREDAASTAVPASMATRKARRDAGGPSSARRRDPAAAVAGVATVQQQRDQYGRVAARAQ